jgi:hypothetical protein
VLTNSEKKLVRIVNEFIGDIFATASTAQIHLSRPAEELFYLSQNYESIAVCLNSFSVDDLEALSCSLVYLDTVLAIIKSRIESRLDPGEPPHCDGGVGV